MSDELKKAVISVLSESLGLDAENIQTDSKLADLGDSLEFMEVIMVVEDKFNVTINDSDAQKMQTVNDLLQFIIANQTSKSVSE